MHRGDLPRHDYPIVGDFEPVSLGCKSTGDIAELGVIRQSQKDGVLLGCATPSKVKVQAQRRLEVTLEGFGETQERRWYERLALVVYRVDISRVHDNLGELR
ncbi:hypothetical protein N7470_005168 [Penicillium chermesinum]|nr:hypothetical protein N7470_005168 [Penicillium chermesinum]